MNKPTPGVGNLFTISIKSSTNCAVSLAGRK